MPAVAYAVRAVERPPAHVRGFQTDGYSADPAVVAAESAPALARGQHQVAHPPISLPIRGRQPLGLRRLQVQADCYAQLAVERGRV